MSDLTKDEARELYEENKGSLRFKFESFNKGLVEYYASNDKVGVSLGTIVSDNSWSSDGPDFEAPDWDEVLEWDYLGVQDFETKKELS